MSDEMNFLIMFKWWRQR